MHTSKGEGYGNCMRDVIINEGIRTYEGYSDSFDSM